jgi:hypothetical protein
MGYLGVVTTTAKGGNPGATVGKIQTDTLPTTSVLIIASYPNRPSAETT